VTAWLAAAALCWATLGAYPDASGARACQYALTATEAAAAHGLPPHVLMAIGRRETKWSAGVVGAAGERGPWQVLAGSSAMTAAELEQPHVSCWAGAGVLYRCRRRAHGDMTRALACYNAGGAGLRGEAGGEYAAEVRRIARRIERRLPWEQGR
jgi:soluble lytic murein transglycosylase-like protein